MKLLKEGADALGITLGEKSQEKFRVYTRLLLEWNEKINLTAVTQEREIIIKHYLDSCPTSIVNLGAKHVDVVRRRISGIPLNLR